MGTSTQYKNDQLKWVVFLSFVAMFVSMLFSCGTSRKFEKNATKYVAGYHISNDSIVADSIPATTEVGFIPVLRPGEDKLSRRDFNKQFRHYKKEQRRNRTDKRTKAKRDFIIEKKQVKQKGKTDRKEVKQEGKTERVKAKQTGRTDRVEVRRENGFFSSKFSLNILLLFFLLMFVVLIIYFLRKKFKSNGTDEASRP